jgi:acetylornithine/N-succinyldiaminopimelate aminotransferase
MPLHMEQLKKREQQVLFSTYARYPLAIARGQGTKVYDFSGRQYTDLLSGIAVCALGHAHPEIAEVVAEQARTLTHTSNLFSTEEQLDLAEKLLGTCSLDRVFFCNSGAEANEAAIKLARRYMSKVAGRDAFEIITLEGSFHGRTLGTLAATGQEAIKDGFAPLPTGFVHVPPGDLPALERAMTPRTAGVLLEIVQGEGGVRLLPPEYLRSVQALCRDRSVLFMVDEVQTGMGRTGRMWAHQHEGLQPDIMTTAKGLANGLPMGAMLAVEQLAPGFAPGSHATTFGGGPLLSRVALKVLEIIERDGLVEHAGRMGAFALAELEGVRSQYPDLVRQVRGLGLMIGIELAHSGKEIWSELLQAGYIVNLSHQTVLRLLPPLIVTEDELSGFVHTLKRILSRTGKVPISPRG